MEGHETYDEFVEKLLMWGHKADSQSAMEWIRAAHYEPCGHERTEWLPTVGEFRCLFCGEYVQMPELLSLIDKLQVE